MTQEKRRAIARDYHFSKLTASEISKKYGVTEQLCSFIADRLHPLSVAESKFDRVLKIKSEDYDAILIILKESGFTFEEVENFSLEEYIDSNI